MQLKPLSVLLICLMAFPILKLQGQQHFTPYDSLPGIIRSYKPSLTSDLPSWAHMLYQYPVNYLEIKRAYEQYTRQHPGESSASGRYFKIWSRALEGYVMDDGTILLPDKKESKESSIRGLDHRGQTPGKAAQPGAGWAFLGPVETYWLNESGGSTPPPSCPWQVNIYSFDVAPTDPSVLYGGSETGFVSKTIDKGLHWQPCGLSYPFGGGVTAVAVHPADPDIVYVSAGNQVHRSTDGGITWSPLLPSGNRFGADRLRIDPVNPQKIFAAAPEGVFVSSDGGNSWVKRWSSPAWDVEVKPNDNMAVFALTRSAGNFSLIQSTDGGNTFQVQSTFPSNITESSGGLLAMTPANPNLMMAVLLSANNTPYLLKGLYSGSVWNWNLQATGNSAAFPMNNGQGYFDLVLGLSPVDANMLFAGTTTLYKSSNGGSTFSAVGGYTGAFNIHPDIQDIALMANGDTWVSTDGGMNLTTDNFTTQPAYHVRVNGLMGSDMWGFDQGWNEDLMVGGRYHNGNTALASFYHPKALRMGGAESPTGWILQGKSRHAAFNDLGNGWILPETAAGEPEGRFLFTKFPNMDEYGGRRGNLVHHPVYSGTLYLGEGTGFWRSEDSGITWDLLFDFPARIRYFQVSFSNPLVMYADIVGGGLVRSHDGELTWESKPALTASPYGNANWKGRLFIALSPYDENVVYACLQNGTWSADIGKIFRSSDGGDTWSDWTGPLSEYMKCIVVQPSADSNDLVYLFTNSTSGKSAKVYYRRENDTGWTLYDNGYPAGMVVNLALPFFRDSKLRVAGNGGVWEAPLADTAYLPLLSPWVEKAHYTCFLDTVQLDDRSMADHSGADWQWMIDPAPAWIDNPQVRNPRLVPGAAGSYNVVMHLTKNGQLNSKQIDGMFSASACPSIYDCNNPDVLPKNEWSLLFVDSEELNYPGLAVMSFDGDPATIWHTRWSTGSDPYPHELQVDLGRKYKISRFTLLNRQDGENGRIKAFELYVSDDTSDWGQPVAAGEFSNTQAPQELVFDTTYSGRYFRLLALSEVNGNAWASVAEFSLTGCVDWPTGSRPGGFATEVAAFPVPAAGKVTIPVPSGEGYSYTVVSTSGTVFLRGSFSQDDASHEADLSPLPEGYFLIILEGKSGTRYRVKVLKQR